MNERLVEIERTVQKIQLGQSAEKLRHIRRIMEDYRIIRDTFDEDLYLKAPFVIEEKLAVLENEALFLKLDEELGTRVNEWILKIEEAVSRRRVQLSADEKTRILPAIKKMKMLRRPDAGKTGPSLNNIVSFFERERSEVALLKGYFTTTSDDPLRQKIASDLLEIEISVAVFRDLLRNQTEKGESEFVKPSETVKVLLFYIHWVDEDPSIVSDRPTIDQVLADVRNWFLEVSYGKASVEIDVCEVEAAGPLPSTNFEIAQRGAKVCDREIDFWKFVNEGGDFLAVYPGLGLSSGRMQIEAEGGVGFRFRLFGVGIHPFERGTFSHELGHALGLRHAHRMECPGVTYGPGCRHVEYGNIYSQMGRGDGHFSCGEKERLGWLEPQIEFFPNTGSYQIAALETRSSETQCLVLPNLNRTRGFFEDIAAGNHQNYLVNQPCEALYIEYRKPLLGDEGISWIDTFLATDDGQLQISCRGEDDLGLPHFWLLDFHPNAADKIMLTGFPDLNYLEGIQPRETKTALGHSFRFKPLHSDHLAALRVESSSQGGPDRNDGQAVSDVYVQCPDGRLLSDDILTLGVGQEYRGWQVNLNAVLEPGRPPVLGIESVSLRYYHEWDRKLVCIYEVVVSYTRTNGSHGQAEARFRLEKDRPLGALSCELNHEVNTVKPNHFHCDVLDLNGP